MSALDDDYEAFPAHTRIPNDELLEVYAELTNNGEYDLLPYEEEWKQRGPLLEFYGYKLRQRYEMDWQPSWVDTNLNPFFCEDSIDSSTPNVMDAIRTHDGLPVAIKATLGWTREASIAFLFTDGNAIEEARNHCVPILDTFIEENIVYLVMPLLRAFNDPPFVTVAEVIDFVDQMVQGIEYMHEQNVAHRDITIGNIMMDASELYPDGFHPVRQNLARDGLAEVVGVMRTHAPVRYYLIDFDSAIAFEKGTPTKLKYAEGKAGRDDEVPEFRIKAPYDPFKVDIFQFGNLLRKEFLQKYSGVEFLEPLVKDMTRPYAAERPSASKLRLKFNTIRNRLTASQMRTHLEPKDITDPLRERLLALGIESLLDSETDDSPEQSSSEAPTTGNSNRSHDSYWSVDPSLDSSMTSQSSVEQGEQEQTSHGPFHIITSALSRARSPARATSKGPDSKPSVWKPAKMADRQRSPSPTPIPPESQAMSKSSDDTRPSARSTSPKPKGPYLRTGKFPWSRSSSPDSAGSPILAVVNQFLAPEASGLYGGDGFDYDLGRPSDNQKGWSQNTYATTYTNYGPSKNELPPQPAAPPVTASQNANAAGAAGAQQSVPGRNRRNTVSTAKPLASFETIAPSSFMSPPQGAAAPAERGGWGTINSIYEEPEPSFGQPFYGEQGAKSTIYSKFNKSVNALPLSLNQSQWEPPVAPPQKETIPIDQFNHSPVDFWGTDTMAKSMTQAPPRPTAATKPVERKESLVDKFVKPTKPSTPIPSKKNAPSQAAAASSPPKPTIPSTRPSLATTAGNRKSTIGVEDASPYNTPYNTPPKSTVNLPPPTNTSPTTTKAKRTKSKKGSISEMPKEKEIEKEKASSPPEDSFSLRHSPEEISTIRGKRRGSGASNTARPSSPFSSLFGSKSSAEPPKDVPPKAPAPKPSFKSSGFGWGSKPKFSPPANVEPDADVFSFASFMPKANDGFGFNPYSQKPSASPVTTPLSEEETSSQPVSTPPSKGGWKTKSSYFPSDPKPAASAPPKEEDDDLARLVAQMAYPNNTPKFSNKPQDDFFSKASALFQFGSSEDTFDNAREAPKAKPAFTAWGNDKRPQVDAAPAFTPTFAAAKPMKATPESVSAQVAKGKLKKTGKFGAKSTIAVESPEPTPTTEAEDPWSMVAPAKRTLPEPPKAQKAEPVQQQESYDDWFSVPGGFPANGDVEYDAVAEPEAAEEEYDPWFAPQEVKTKPKTTAVPVAPAAKPMQSAWAAPTKANKANKTSRFAFFGDEEADGQEDEANVFKVVEKMVPEEKEEPKGPLAKGKKAKVTKAPAAPQFNKWSAWGMETEEPQADEDDLAADFAATLEAQPPSKEEPTPPIEVVDQEAEKEDTAAASKSTAKANPPPQPKGKAKKKGKR